MNPLLRASPLALAVALAMASHSALATPISYTTSGIIQSGHDRIGLFGPVGGDLSGKSFIQTVSTDSNGFAMQSYNAMERYIAQGSARVNVSVSIDGKSATWVIPQASGMLALNNGLSQNLFDNYDQLFLSINGGPNIATDGSNVEVSHNVLARSVPFLPLRDLAQPLRIEPWAKDTDSHALLTINKDGAQTAMMAKLATAGLNVLSPATATIQYVDAVNAVSGSEVEVSWAKWWGASANRWELLQNEAVVCSATLPALGLPDALQEQRGACKVNLAAGENRFVARLCQHELCSDSAPYRLDLPGASGNPNAPAWNATAVYQQGAQVTYQHQIYQARYWVQHTAPGDAAAWQPVANTKFGTAQPRVTDWKNAASAAYSIQFDDYCGWSNDAGQLLGEQELALRQLVAGFGVMSGSCGDPAWSPHWPNLQAFISRGHEVFNHSYDHGHPLDADWAWRKWGGNDLEIRESTELATRQLGGYRMQFFGFPFDVATEEQLQYLKARPQYLGTRTPNYWQANGVNAKSFADPFRLRFQVYMNADQGSSNPASLHNYLSETIAQQGFGLRVFHSVADTFYESVPLEAYRQHLDEVKAQVDAGQLWVGTVTDVLKYRFAREHCSLRPAQPVALGLLLSFDNQAAACSKYSTPVTVAITGVTASVTAWQGGRELPVVQRNGAVLVTADPREGAVLLR